MHAAGTLQHSLNVKPLQEGFLVGHLCTRFAVLVFLAVVARFTALAQCSAQVSATADPNTATVRAIGSVQGGNCGTCSAMNLLGRHIPGGCGASPNVIDATEPTECRMPGIYQARMSGTCSSTNASGACVPGPEITNEASFTILQSRVTQLDVSVTDVGPGLKRFDFEYALQNLAPPRGLVFSYRPLGGVANTEHHDTIPTWQGTYSAELDTECFTPGAYEVVVAIGECPPAGREEVQAFEVEAPWVKIIEIARDATGQQSAILSYGFPNQRTPGNRRLRLGWAVTPDSPGGPPLYDQEAPAQFGTLPPILIPPQQAQRMLLASAIACGLHPAFDRAKVEPCCCEEPACEVGRPIRLWDGAVTYAERDPLPSSGLPLFTRSYDSAVSSVGRFGRGWRSLFDSWSTRGIAGGIDTVMLRTEDGTSAVFQKLEGIWQQTWPRGVRVRHSLAEKPDGTLVYRQAGSTLTRELSGGRLTRIADTASGRGVTITYDAQGNPVSVAEERGNWSCAITTTGGLITRIEVTPEVAWTFAYAGQLLETVTPDGMSAWRTYGYTNDRLSTVHDAAGALIESHAYDAAGRATTSIGATDDITGVDYLATNANGESVTNVTYATGRVETYAMQFVNRQQQTVTAEGGCSSCGAGDAVYARDDVGRVVRQQDARGYVTTFTYSAHRLSATTTFARPLGCDPETDPTHCRLTAAELLETGLEATATTTTQSLEYGDPNWPDRPTAVVSDSVYAPLLEKRESYTFDATTGTVVSRSTSGWTGDPAQAETRTIATSLYDGTEGASFAPGGAFDPAWLTLPQPRGPAKQVDGARTDVEDKTLFVYYPAGGSVPGPWRGYLAAVRDAVGHVTRYENYDVFGNARRVIAASGVVTERVFDTLGRPTVTTIKAVGGCDTNADPVCGTDLVATRTYDGAGPLQWEQQPGGGVVHYDYDGRGRTWTISRGPSLVDLRERVVYGYDSATGRKSSETYGVREGTDWVVKRTESYAYDVFGRLETLTHGDGSSIGYTYTATDQIATVRDETHAAPNTVHAYDPAGRLTTLTQTLADAPGGVVVTRYGYDPDGNLTSVTDPNGNVTSYLHDDFNELLRQVSPVSGTTTYAYDPAGNLTSSTDANGAATTRTYDAMNRPLSAVSVKGNQTESVTWTYGGTAAAPFARGRLVTMSDPAGTTSYAYDRRGLVLQEYRSHGELDTSTSYRYDADGNRAAVGDVSYAYDYAGRPVSAASPEGAIVTSATYLPFGPLTSLAVANGTTQTFTYDTRYRPLTRALHKGSVPLVSHTYTHDPKGNVLTIGDDLDPAYNRAFGYDDLNRLTVANSGSGLWGSGSYAYDGMGNMLTSILGPTTRTFTYSGTTPKLSTVTYDAAGNELLIPSGSPESYTPRNLRAGADYDGRGVRVEVRFHLVHEDATVLRLFDYTPDLRLERISDYRQDTSGIHPVWDTTEWTGIVWFGDLPILQRHQAPTPIVAEIGPEDPPPPPPTRRYTFTDHLGTPIAQTDESGTLVWRAEYQPYGAIHTMRTGLATDQMLRLPGQDVAGPGDNGATYNVFRWYRAEWGRYTQADPIGLLGGLNLYSYVGENPLNFSDLLGLARRCVWSRGSQFVGAGAFVHHLPGQSRNQEWFNLISFTASCDGCETPTNVTVDGSLYTNTRTDLNIIQQAMIPDITRIQPQVEFEDRRGPCSQTVMYGVSWRTLGGAAHPFIGRATNQMLETTLRLCYDCQRCD